MVSEATRQSYRDFLKQQREMCDSASEIIFTHFGVSPTSILGGSLLYNLDAGITIQTYCNDHKSGFLYLITVVLVFVIQRGLTIQWIHLRNVS